MVEVMICLDCQPVWSAILRAPAADRYKAGTRRGENGTGRVTRSVILAGSASATELAELAEIAKRAGVAELADAPDLGSGAERRGGSSPSTRTTTHSLPCRNLPLTP